MSWICHPTSTAGVSQPSMPRSIVDSNADSFYLGANNALSAAKLGARRYSLHCSRQHSGLPLATARRGRNLKTGAVIHIPARRTLHFKPAKELAKVPNASSKARND